MLRSQSLAPFGRWRPYTWSDKPFTARPWPLLADRYWDMARLHPEYLAMIEIIDSVAASRAADHLLGNWTINGLHIADVEHRQPPYSVITIEVHGPGRTSGATVTVWHVSTSGLRDTVHPASRCMQGDGDDLIMAPGCSTGSPGHENNAVKPVIQAPKNPVKDASTASACVHIEDRYAPCAEQLKTDAAQKQLAEYEADQRRQEQIRAAYHRMLMEERQKERAFNRRTGEDRIEEANQAALQMAAYRAEQAHHKSWWEPGSGVWDATADILCGFMCYLGPGRKLYQYVTISGEVCVVLCLNVTVQGGTVSISHTYLGMSKIAKSPDGNGLKFLSGGVSVGFITAKPSQNGKYSYGGCVGDGTMGCFSFGQTNDGGGYINPSVGPGAGLSAGIMTQWWQKCFAWCSDS